MKIIKIGALWCPACLITNKALDKIIDENDNIELINLDYDFDEEEVSYIFSESFDTPRMGQAIMNRLLKAAGHQVIEV